MEPKDNNKYQIWKKWIDGEIELLAVAENKGIAEDIKGCIEIAYCEEDKEFEIILSIDYPKTKD